MENEKKGNKLGQVVITILVILLVITCIVVAIVKYVDLDKLFTTTVNRVDEKVTITDEGISASVNKLYDATVIVNVYQNSELAGWGSGVVYKTDDKYGYILTNAHVVDESQQISITFTNEKEVEGTVLGSDTYSDIAVVRVDKDNVIKVAEIGSSTDLELGDTVFAVGTPVSLDYAFTVTRGILSGKNRMVSMTSSNSNSFSSRTSSTDSWYISLLQIDASINSGNSGGPLANANGEVVGITNSKLSSSSSYYSSTASIENIGFAIPIEDALNVASILESDGKVTRPLLGISMTTIEGASYNGVTVDKDITEGVVVADVSASSNADKAGIKKGDVITKIDGITVKDYKYLKYYLYKHKINDKIILTIIRNGKEKEIEVTLKA